MGRSIVWQLYIDWDFDGTYTDESARLVSASGSMQFYAPGESVTAGRGIVDQCTLLLNNADGRYSPLNSSGTLFSTIQSGKAYHAAMYLRVSVDGGSNYYRAFTGVIKTPQETGPTYRETSTVSIDCRSRDEAILQKRVSTSAATFNSIVADGWTEEQIITQWLKDAGLTDGTHFVSQAYATAHPTYTATLDPGLFVIPAAWLDDESPVEDCWDIAAACGGRFYFHPDDVTVAPASAKGRFVYENATHWLLSPHTTSQETFTAASYEQLTPSYIDRELYESITVEYSARTILDTAVLWRPEETPVVPANSARTIVAKLRQPAYTIQSIDLTAITSGGDDISSDISTGRTDYAQRVELTLTNANTTKAAQVALLQLQGKAVDGRPAGEETAESNNTFWNNRSGRNRSIRGNPYIQTRAQALYLSKFLKDRQELPRLFYRLAGCPGVASRRLGDRVTINDSSVMSSSRDAFLIGIRWRLSDKGFEQDLDAVDAENMYPYQSSSPSYFVTGTNKLGAADAARGRVFY